MNFVSALSCLSQITKKLFITEVSNITQTCNFAIVGKVKKGKKTASIKKIEIPVETDPEKLVSYLCGSNILKEGGEDIKLKPDSEYPDWLWNIRIGPPKKLEELDPSTKAYWRKLRKTALREHNLKRKYMRY